VVSGGPSRRLRVAPSSFLRTGWAVTTYDSSESVRLAARLRLRPAGDVSVDRRRAIAEQASAPLDPQLQSVGQIAEQMRRRAPALAGLLCRDDGRGGDGRVTASDAGCLVAALLPGLFKVGAGVVHGRACDRREVLAGRMPAGRAPSDADAAAREVAAMRPRVRAQRGRSGRGEPCIPVPGDVRRRSGP
jgi:hypothetical protein